MAAQIINLLLQSLRFGMGASDAIFARRWRHIPENNAVFHMMGHPQETRHIIMHNEQLVISPSWSIHSGIGTSNYNFIWAMCGENQEFDDMDHIKTLDLR